MLVLAVASAVIGYNRGARAQLVSLAILLMACAAASWWYEAVASLLWKAVLVFGDDSAAGGGPADVRIQSYLLPAVSFGLVLMTVKALLSFAGRWLGVIAFFGKIRAWSRWTGLTLALLEAYLLVDTSISVLLTLPYEQVQAILDRSVVVGLMLQNGSGWIGYWLH